METKNLRSLTTLLRIILPVVLIILISNLLMRLGPKPTQLTVVSLAVNAGLRAIAAGCVWSFIVAVIIGRRHPALLRRYRNTFALGMLIFVLNLVISFAGCAVVSFVTGK